MPIQWESITLNEGESLIEPREIYSSLNNRRWDRLRPEQTEVLDAWFERRDLSRDLVIKQNTGSGKTLTGLLIALSSLHEGVGPAAFLVPDNYLIEQVKTEATDAGIPMTTNWKDLDFQSSKAILVTTFHKLFNGRSVFGVRGAKDAKASLGTIIIDDAHTAVRASQSQLSVQVPPEHPAFGKILDLFDDELKRQSPKAHADIKGGERGGPVRVPFGAVARHADELMTIMQPFTKEPGEFQDIFFCWPLVADTLAYSILTVTSEGIEIRPPCPDVSMITAFDKARRRIYLTATLEDESILVTEMGADPDGVYPPITPKRASDLGDRIILTPREINPHSAPTAVHGLVRHFADGDRPGTGSGADPVNVVVLVPGDHAAEAWSDVADETLHVTDMRPCIERMRNGEHLGVVVLVNKYDGVDLPGDACRLLVIDGVPTPSTPHERRAAEALDGSATFRARQVQRIEQGIGRGTRDVDDYCAVLLLTDEAALTLHDQNARKHYSPATRAQIELSRQVADQIRGEGIDAVADLLDLFLRRDQHWTSLSRKATATITYDTANRIAPLATARREAFNRMRNGDAPGALEVLRRGIDSIDDDREKGWYLEELAAYQHHVNPAEAQRTLESARKKNPTVLKPDETATPKRTRKRPAPQAAAVAEHLKHYSDGTEMKLHVASIFESIVWGLAGTADTSEEQIRLLGSLLGFESTRPEKDDWDGGPDNLWKMPDGRFAVIELKTEITRENPVILKSEAEQLTHSIAWLHDAYGRDSRSIPVLLHPSATLNRDAHLPEGARIMTADGLKQLKEDVTTFIKELVDANKTSDPTAIEEGLKRNRLTAGRIIENHTVKASRRR